MGSCSQAWESLPLPKQSAFHGTLPANPELPGWCRNQRIPCSSIPSSLPADPELPGWCRSQRTPCSSIPPSLGDELPVIKWNQMSVFMRRFDRQIIFPVRLRYDNDDNSNFSSQMALESFPAITVHECQWVS